MNGITRKVPEDINQRLVVTPYGKGLVIRTEKKFGGNQEKKRQEVRLLEWGNTSVTKALSGYPILYTFCDLPSVEQQIGDDVICLFGRGILTNIVIENKKALDPPPQNSDEKKEDNDDITPPSPENISPRYDITLTSWRLASRSTVKCYLSSPASFSTVRKRTIPEMDAYERVSFAQTRKTLASQQFTSKNYAEALQLYAGAIDAVRFVQHDSSSTNELRADLVKVMITCSNNAATCSAKLGKWMEAGRFAQNAMVLMDAVYKKRGLNIHKILNKGGVKDVRLFGEWKVKSLICMAKAVAEKKEYAKAIELLKDARESIVPYNDVKTSQLEVLEKDVKKLMALYLQKKKGILKKEKQRAQAMFGGKKTESVGDATTTSHDVNKESETTSSNEDEIKPPEQIHKKKVVTNDQDLTQTDNITEVPESPTSSIKKKVTFNAKLEEWSDDDDEAWYSDHKEALILSGVGAIMAGVFFLMRGSSRR